MKAIEFSQSYFIFEFGSDCLPNEAFFCFIGVSDFDIRISNFHIVGVGLHCKQKTT